RRRVVPSARAEGILAYQMRPISGISEPRRQRVRLVETADVTVASNSMLPRRNPGQNCCPRRPTYRAGACVLGEVSPPSARKAAREPHRVILQWVSVRIE